MARVQLGDIVTGLRGSIGGFTFHNNQSGLIVRLRSGTSKSGTAKQFAARQLPNKYAAMWANLSLIDQSEWNTFAGLHTHITPFGDERIVSGFNWFQSINYNLELVGSGTVVTPPTYVSPDHVEIYRVTFSSLAIGITFEHSFNPANSALLIWSTRPLTRVSTSLRSSFRQTKVISPGPFVSVDITPEWATAQGLPWSAVVSGGVFKIGIMVQTIELSSGVASPGRIFLGEASGIVPGIGSMVIGSTFIIG